MVIKMNDDFIKQMEDLLGSELDDFLKSLQQPQIKAFYLNPTKKDALKYLDKSYIKQHPLVEEGYYFDYENYPLGKSPYFNCGLFYIQEPSAMLVSEFLNAQKGDFILDMCSAPGGKSCRVGHQIGNEGLLITNDISTLRAKILSENIERFGLQNTIVTNIDPLNYSRDLDDFFNKIILDAPCSGEGMFRKTDKAISTWSHKKIEDCVLIQKQLIDKAFAMLKPGGFLIYSTCTYNTQENEEQVQYMLNHYDCSLVPLQKSHGMQEGIQLKEAVRLYPHQYSGEGHFIALIQKHGQTPQQKKIPVLKSHISKANYQLVKEFYLTYLNIEMPTLLYDNKNHIYAIQEHFPDLKGHRILRNGLYLGECKKNRFEPSLALALTLTKDDVKQYYSFDKDSIEIQKYLHGESIEGTNQKGYGVLFVDNYPLSFYKESNKQAKNLYPKGLRK